MSTFVLVHGAWHGGWCWQRVLPRLVAAGHTAYAPTLTGMGERAHLLTREVDLDTHIQDIVNVLVYEDLWDVVLVGHSYAGMVITGVAEQIPERLTQLIYLDAFVPLSGQSIRQMMPPERVEQEAALVRAQGDGWKVPPPPPEFFGVTDARDARWVARRLTAQPHACSAGSVQITRPAAATLRKDFIHCTQGRSVFQPFADRARLDARWRVREVPAAHAAMLTAPALLSKTLLDLVAQPQYEPQPRDATSKVNRPVTA